MFGSVPYNPYSVHPYVPFVCTYVLYTGLYTGLYSCLVSSADPFSQSAQPMSPNFFEICISSEIG